MASPSPAVAHARAKVGALSRDRATDDPEYIEARRALAAANLESAVLKAITNGPPLTDEQRSRIAEILEGTHST